MESIKLRDLKKKKTGWELLNLLNLLKMEPRRLDDFSKTFPLSAINEANDKFVIIRKFASREVDGKIELLKAPDTEGSDLYPRSQLGMTLASTSPDESSSHIVMLPNSIDCESIELENDTISIHHTKGVTTTNFTEIACLRTFDKLGEEDILTRFNSLSNAIS